MRSKRSHVVRALAVLSFAVLAGTGGVASAGPPEQPGAAPAQKPLADALDSAARADYETGKALFLDGDFANAVVKFEHAYELSGNARLFWNVAVCEKSLRHYARMLAAVERYRRQVGEALTDQERQSADDLVKAAKALVSTLDLKVSEAGAQVFVDDEPVGVTPLPGPVVVDVGARRVRVVKKGFREVSLVEQAAGATALVVPVTLVPEVHEGRLVVEAGPGDAITLDGRPLALGRWEGAVASGGHTLRVSAPGKTAYQSEVGIEDDKLRRIPVTLEPAARSGSTAWLWVGGGAVVAAGLAVGGYFLLRPREGAAMPGTLSPGTVHVSFAPGVFRLEGPR